MSESTKVSCAECGAINSGSSDVCGQCDKPLNGPLVTDHVRMEECLACMSGEGPCAKHAGRPVDIEKKALENLLDAVEGVLFFSWADGDLDEDAAQAIDRLRLARNDYGVIQRVKNDH